MNKYVVEILNHEDYILRLILDKLKKTKSYLEEKYKFSTGVRFILEDPNLKEQIILVRTNIFDKDIIENYIELCRLFDEEKNEISIDIQKNKDKINIKSLALSKLIKERI